MASLLRASLHWTHQWRQTVRSEEPSAQRAEDSELPTACTTIVLTQHHHNQCSCRETNIFQAARMCIIHPLTVKRGSLKEVRGPWRQKRRFNRHLVAHLELHTRTEEQYNHLWETAGDLGRLQDIRQQHPRNKQSQICMLLLQDFHPSLGPDK